MNYREFLTADGWREYKAVRREIWCKRWKNAPKCKCNSEQEGIQVLVAVYLHDGRVTFEIEVTGEKPDGTWVKLSAYPISAAQLPYVLNDQANQLVAAWTVLAQQLSPCDL